MTYRVVYRRHVLRRVHEHAFLAFERGGDERAITDALVGINRRLTTVPAEVGESRADAAVRVLVVDPLTAYYEVFEAERIVVVFDLVYRYPR